MDSEVLFNYSTVTGSVSVWGTELDVELIGKVKKFEHNSQNIDHGFRCDKRGTRSECERFLDSDGLTTNINSFTDKPEECQHTDTHNTSMDSTLNSIFY